MPQYDSSHTGQEVDEAVDIVLGNKSKGDNKTPVYLNANGVAVAVTKDTTAMQNSANPITSGGAYTGLSVKLPMTDVDTNTALGTSDTKVPSCGAVEGYVENVMDTKQDPVSGGIGINVKNNVVSVDTDYESITTIGDFDNKWEYLPELEEGNGDDLVAKMEAAKHSSFDLSKFTKVGSPIVTSDGIASGFSYQNFLRILNPPTLTNNNSWEVITPILKVNSVAQMDNVFNYFYGAVATLNRLVVSLKNDNTILVLIGTDNYTDIIRDTTLTYTANDTFQFKFTHSLNQYAVFYKKNNSNWIFLKSVTNSDGFSVSAADICNGFAGSADLKTTSIIVDGVEVFSGNKTGIDTIKPVDFTAITSSASSPFVNPSLPFSDNGLTISADGIASGFSSSNLIQVAKNIVLGDDFEIHYSFTTASVLTEGYQGLYRLIKSGTNTAIGVLFKLNSAVRLECAFGGEYYTIKNTMSPNTKYKIKIIVKNNLFSCVYSTDNGATWQQDTAPKATNMNITDAIGLIYLGNNSVQNYWYGSIDLNSFKIYVKGELVYQPCLKIPYTLTSQGNKIVDAQYKSRVEDEEAQAGYTPYDVLETEITEDFIKVGSPTISDGVASGFSDNNYLYEDLTLSYQNELIMCHEFIWNGVNPSNTGYLVTLANGTSATARITSYISYYQNKTVLSTYLGSIYVQYPVPFQANIPIQIKYILTPTTGRIIVTQNGQTLKDVASSFTMNNFIKLLVGRTVSGGGTVDGSIDLNTLKIYVDGKLVYTPYKLYDTNT